MAQLTYDNRMAAADALYLIWERDRTMRPHICGMLKFEGEVDEARLAHKMELMARVFPRRSQRVADVPWCTAPPRWVDDPQYDPRMHMLQIDAPGDGSTRALLDWMTPWASQPLNPDRPQWANVVVRGLPGGGWALMNKMHHAMNDGVGAVEMFKTLLDMGPDDPPADLPPERVLDVPTFDRLVAEAWQYELSAATALASRTGKRLVHAVTDPAWFKGRLNDKREAVQFMRSHQSSTPLSPLLRGRSMGLRLDTMPVSRQGLKAGSNAGGGTVNDGFLAAISGAMTKYHQHFGSTCEALRVLVPVSTRGDLEAPQKAGNTTTGINVRLPLGIDDPVERIKTINALTTEAKHTDRSAEVLAPALSAIVRLPKWLAFKVLATGLKSNDLICTNVPGIPFPVYLAGARLAYQTSFPPRTGAAINFALIGMGENLSLGINSDPAAVTDPLLLVDMVRASFDEIISLA